MNKGFSCENEKKKIEDYLFYRGYDYSTLKVH